MSPVNRRIIGVDESGKGDFFGPLVIAAFLCSKSEEEKLKEMGVRDGKLIADKKLRNIADLLKVKFPYNVYIYHPKQYNQDHKKIKNLNHMLAAGHAQVISEIANNNKVDLAVSDKFGKSELTENALLKIDCNIKLKQIVRGERIIQVAAASILARAAYLDEMDRISTEIGFELPRGAAPKVDQEGRKLIEAQGIEILNRVAKTHFKNYNRIVNPTLFAT